MEAEAAGVYAGLGAVGTVLIAAAIILTIAATIRSRTLPRIEKRSDAPATEGVIYDTGSAAAAADAGANESGSGWHSSASAPLAPPKASASDLVETMAFFLSKVVEYPRVGNAIIDELIGNPADEAIARAAARATVHTCRANRGRIHRLAFDASFPALMPSKAPSEGHIATRLKDRRFSDYRP